MVCNDAALNWYKYGLAEKVIFPTSSDYFLAFFQNLLANILNINYIYQKLLTDTTTTPVNSTDVYYETGKILYLLFDVQPITTEALYAEEYDAYVQQLASEDDLKLNVDSLASYGKTNSQGVFKLHQDYYYPEQNSSNSTNKTEFN